MADINDPNGLTKNEFKIIVAGNLGSGKSTSIREISQVPVIGTETKPSEANSLQQKETTTTAMEYGVAWIENKKIHLYGTPGQRRFDFMTDILCKGASGMVLMINNGCQNPLQEIDYYLNKHNDFLLQHPAIIAITHYDDMNTSTTLSDYHRYIFEQGFSCPVIRVDARKKIEVEKLLLQLLLQIIQAKTGKNSYENSSPHQVAA